MCNAITLSYEVRRMKINQSTERKKTSNSVIWGIVGVVATVLSALFIVPVSSCDPNFVDNGRTLDTQIVKEGNSDYGFLEVNSHPSGALVFVDGVFKGYTQLDSLSLKPGIYKIRVTKEGYYDENFNFSVQENENYKKTITLKRIVPVVQKNDDVDKPVDSGKNVTVPDNIKSFDDSIQIPYKPDTNSDSTQDKINAPTGADIFINGLKTNRVTNGNHKIYLNRKYKIKLEKPGFEIWEGEFTFEKGDDLKIFITLNPVLNEW
jgi:hypothetical protein